ncbi:sarcosine oxidase subunit gamma [Rhodobacter ferrooxidans]|uniref:Sarcosine oxidase gamma subunit n=1 Tax=Rhodobacter ferrooxidans TaxID=371731 RepID=C8S366_9RHOB|nr:sarcosine oxidase subunit gamma family protein [Rhodobacter sp. SW2]EEW24548.1 Sarcosine oxidase gamma subunit [Rhodobacter sp. SW2]
MPSLIAKAPLTATPLQIGGAKLSAIDPGPITSVAPFRGKEAAVAVALERLGLSFPAPGQYVESNGLRLVWTGRDQAFLIGAAPEGLEGLAALTDQSDGWAALLLEGPAAEAVLARLYPLDLRASVFPPGHASRSALNHMLSILLRTGADSFQIMVFRSMAQTAWHELHAAMTGLAARP